MIRTIVSTSGAVPKLSYPYIGVLGKTGHATNIIVLFTSKGTGVCIEHYNKDQVGKYASSWSQSFFTAMNGSITLSNK